MNARLTIARILLQVDPPPTPDWFQTYVEWEEMAAEQWGSDVPETLDSVHGWAGEW